MYVNLFINLNFNKDFVLNMLTTIQELFLNKGFFPILNYVLTNNACIGLYMMVENNRYLQLLYRSRDLNASARVVIP